MGHGLVKVMVYIELSRSEIEIPWHVKVLVKITWRFSQLMMLVPSQKQPAGLPIRISWVSVSDLFRCYICISISLKQDFWTFCIVFFVFYSQRKESVPLLWHNQMCYSSTAVSLVRTTSLLYLVRSFHKKSQKRCFSSIRFRPPGRGGKFDQIWQKEWSAQFCTVLQWKMVIWFIALRCKNPCFQLHNYWHCKTFKIFLKKIFWN